MVRRIIFILSALVVVVIGISGYFFRSMKASRCAEPVLSYSLDLVRDKKNLVDIAVLGAGPAGWSAALYGARLGLNTLVITGAVPGGQLTKTTLIENWPGIPKILGTQAMDRIAHQALSFGAEQLNETVSDVDLCTWPYLLTTDEGKKIHAMTVIVATGAQPRKLGVLGEEEYWGRGVTTCAVCDAPFYKGKPVVVVGGGDSAIEEVKQLANYASTITLLVRKDHLRASYAMQRQLATVPQLEIRYHTEIERIAGDERGVKEVQLKNNKTHETSVLSISGVFLAIGHVPNTQLFTNKLSMNDQGYLAVQGRSQETSVPGVFAAGDVEDDRYRQAGVAAGHGISAALDAAAFLNHVGLTKEFSKSLGERAGYFEETSEERAQVPHLTSVADFEQEVLKKEGLVILDFYTDPCVSCRQMAPSYEMAAARFAQQARFFKVNADQAQDLTVHLKVARVPYLVAFLNGTQVAMVSKAMTKKDLFSLIESLLTQTPNHD